MPINTPDRRLGINDLRAQIMEQIVIYKSSLPAQIGFNELGSAVNVLFRNSIVSSINASINRQTYKTQITNFTLKKSFDKQGIETGFGDKDFRSKNNYISQL